MRARSPTEQPGANRLQTRAIMIMALYNMCFDLLSCVFLLFVAFVLPSLILCSFCCCYISHDVTESHAGCRIGVSPGGAWRASGGVPSAATTAKFRQRSAAGTVAQPPGCVQYFYIY